ncbi:MAG: hypothetical protein COV45_01195 [Deltaproteobacteria bacterium CG11_big_fil_rev_8_21_14_0_20_47_16]|nr:MAG: hypothetical protein COV45_01195 [Deltaproteobacteria bacterium CG11_big_fil_rev_8_21_14_0_20_47_16]
MTEPTEIDAATAKQLLDQGKAILIDVRENGEYATEHIPAAQLHPLSTFNPNQFTSCNKKLIIHCRSGKRSCDAASRLLNAGCMEVYSLKGGIMSWKEAGLATAIDQHAPIDIMRQVQIAAGTLIVLGSLLGYFLSPAFLLLAGFVGAGLLFSGITGYCGMAKLLLKLPYNKTKTDQCQR